MSIVFFAAMTFANNFFFPSICSLLFINIVQKNSFSGAASTARALSTYLDSLLGYPMRNFFAAHLALHSRILGDYADLFAMSICLILTSKFNLNEIIDE
jgi:hypothetical protein